MRLELGEDPGRGEKGKEGFEAEKSLPKPDSFSTFSSIPSQAPPHQVPSAEISSSVCFVSIRSLVSSALPGTEELSKYLLNTNGRHSDLYSSGPITWMGRQPQ